MRAFALAGAALLAEVEVQYRGQADALVRSSRAEAAAAQVTCRDGSTAEQEHECSDAMEAAVAVLSKGADLLRDANLDQWTADLRLDHWARVVATRRLATLREPEPTRGVEVTYIRHGFSCANANRDIFGKSSLWNKIKAEEFNVMRYTDPPLTDCGVAASKRAGMRLMKAYPHGFHFVGASSLRRAVETAAGEFDGTGREARFAADGTPVFAAPNATEMLEGARPTDRIAVLPFFLEGSPGQDNQPKPPAEQRAELREAVDLDARPSYAYLEEARALFDLAVLAEAEHASFQEAFKEARRNLEGRVKEMLDEGLSFHDADGVLDTVALESWKREAAATWVKEHEEQNPDQTLLIRARPALSHLVETAMPAASRRDTAMGSIAAAFGRDRAWKDTPSFAHAEQFLAARVIPDLRKALPKDTMPRLAIVSHSITMKEYVHKGHVKNLPGFESCRELLMEENNKGKRKERKPFNNEGITVTYEFDPSALTLQPRACRPTLMPDQVEELFVDIPAGGPGIGAEPVPTAVNARELRRCGNDAFVQMADEVQGGKCLVDFLSI